MSCVAPFHPLQASLQDYDAALASAQKCVELKPEWAKGFSRLGAAYHGLGQYDKAIKAYEDGEFGDLSVSASSAH